MVLTVLYTLSSSLLFYTIQCLEGAGQAMNLLSFVARCYLQVKDSEIDYNPEMTVAYLNQILSLFSLQSPWGFCIGRYIQENTDLRKQFMLRVLICGF